MNSKVWIIMRIILIVAVAFVVSMIVQSIAAAEEVAQPRYSQYSETTEWYDSFGRLRYGPQGNFAINRTEKDREADVSDDSRSVVASEVHTPRVVYSSSYHAGPWVSPAVRSYHWERVPIPMGIPPKDAWRGLLDWHF